MATEIFTDELVALSSQEPSRYGILARMSPLWRTFLLDEFDQASLAMAEVNTSHDSRTYSRLIARITGIEAELINSTYQAGRGVVAIVPPTDSETFKEFLERKRSNQKIVREP